MNDFNASLLREKFIIYDPEKGMVDKKSTVIALSNRFVTELRDPKGKLIETFVVRAQNMHSAVRLAARLIQAFEQGGPIARRPVAYDWQAVWDSVVSDYEYAYNPQRWIAVYHDGKCIFHQGEHHPLLDMIEKCDHENNKDYDYAVPLAETLFEQSGKNLKIEHESNVALSVSFEKNSGRVGIIQRGPNKTTTFTFTAQAKPEQTLKIPQCLNAAAAFLEGIQLSFLVGTNTEKLRIGKIERFSREEKQTREGRERLKILSAEITNLETVLDVHYRPERPQFKLIMAEAERMAQRTS
jgi:hypothetical protein